jgi:hypothetical protein
MVLKYQKWIMEKLQQGIIGYTTGVKRIPKGDNG